MTGRLFVDFCGEERALAPDGELTFGRAGDLEIDDNPYLHRLLGRFVPRDGVWWLDHLGTRTPLSVRDTHGPSAATVAPGTSLALTHGEFVVSFSAGPTNYELLGATEEHEWAIDLLGAEGLAGTRTLEWGRVELNADQRLLLLAMCEHRLVDPGALDGALPTNRQGAARLGWSLPKFNRKLDHLCEKLHRAGVAGVHGGAGASALDRRRRLVDHVLEAGLVAPSELPLLDEERAA
jgi:hypothetical protein